MKPFLLLCLLMFAGLSHAQTPDCEDPILSEFAEIDGNQILAPISAAANDFYEWVGPEGYRGLRILSEEGNPVALLGSSVWLSGLTADGEYRTLTRTYGSSSTDPVYVHGPLNSDGSFFASNCNDFNRVWKVNRQQIEQHIADFADNGNVDFPQDEILGWPGLGNANFFNLFGFELPDSGDLAPFMDLDEDGIYEPLNGEYPVEPHAQTIPEQMTWNVANLVAPNGHFDQFRAELHNTYWVFSCQDDRLIDHTLFARYNVINRGTDSLEDLSMGIWADFDIGCYLDDLVGSNPEQNSFFSYNMDNVDESDCENLVGGSFGENPPVQAVTMLNKPLRSFVSHIYGPIIDPPFAIALPLGYPSAIYNAMRGRWNDGSPIRESGFGYNQIEGDTTTFQFSGNPTIEGDWSHYDVESFNLWTNNNTIGSTNFGKWKNGDRSTLDVAFSYHREPGRDFLGNVELMYEDIEDLQAFYDNQFEQSCSPSSTPEVSLETVQIYPNPVQNELYLARSELSSMESIKIIDALGRTILQAQHIDEFVPVASLPSGYYSLLLRSNNQLYTSRFIKE